MVTMLERQHIQGRPAEAIAGALLQAAGASAAS
jgi:hypothetical protein